VDEENVGISKSIEAQQTLMPSGLLDERLLTLHLTNLPINLHLLNAIVSAYNCKLKLN
jgi:hypothetical protein